MKLFFEPFRCKRTSTRMQGTISYRYTLRIMPAGKIKRLTLTFTDETRRRYFGTKGVPRFDEESIFVGSLLIHTIPDTG